MLYSALSRFFLLAGVVLLGLAGYFYFAGEPGPRLAIESLDIEVAGCVPGEDKDVLIHFVNRSEHPIRVLGLTGC